MVSRSKVMNDLHPWHWTLLSLRNSTRYGRSQITKNVHHVMLQLHLYFTEMIWPLSKEHYSKLWITTFMAMTFKLFTVHVETYGFQHWTLHDLENDPKVKGQGTRSCLLKQKSTYQPYIFGIRRQLSKGNISKPEVTFLIRRTQSIYHTVQFFRPEVIFLTILEMQKVPSNHIFLVLGDQLLSNSRSCLEKDLTFNLYRN